MVPPRISWSLAPPIPSPSLDDAVVFADPSRGRRGRAPATSAAERKRRQREGFQRAMHFWRSRFGDHEAWTFVWRNGQPALVPMPRDTSPRAAPKLP
jgi:hypothetical protein